ncbi:hypothetical protein C0993_009810 [Termitomyces sp. T159_Od127]|nr:hypothetical protein C0993_009810 [Termitomyces sp. T159_Od127]
MQYPDVIQYVTTFFNDHPETTSFILDTEIVPIDQGGGFRSFQELSSRARKDVQLQDVQIFVSILAFDLMYLNGEVLLERAFRERRELLVSRFPSFTSPDKRLARFKHVESCTSTEGRDAIEAFLVKAIESRCEGLMIKLLDNEPIQDALAIGEKLKAPKSRRKPLPATYEPDKRTSAWLKLKKDYLTGFGDTVDMIPIGAWYGNGRKAQWWSPILLGLWQPDCGRIVAVCKCMSGFTDAFYKVWISSRYAKRLQIHAHNNRCGSVTLEVESSLFFSVYFKPMEVWEIRGADITLSPVSIAAKGLVSASRGLSIRFPRFIKLREDKSIEQANTPTFLAKLWGKQEAKDARREFDHKFNDEGELIDTSGSSSDLDPEDMYEDED